MLDSLESGSEIPHWPTLLFCTKYIFVPDTMYMYCDIFFCCEVKFLLSVGNSF